MSDQCVVGFVGLGNMGHPMARNLQAAGYSLCVYDVREAALDAFRNSGARIATSVAEVSATAQIVFASLPTPDSVLAVTLGEGGLIGGAAMKTFVDLSTTGPRVAQDVARALQAAGVAVLDAPVSGGVAGAVKGTVAVMAAGDAATFETCRPMLAAIGKVFYVGSGVGQGQMMKLVNNLLAATALAATSEAMVLGAKAGLDPQTMLDVINASSGRNSATVDKFEKPVLQRTFDYGFATALMAKDVRLAVQEAEALGVTLWVGNAVKHIWTFAVSQGSGDQDFTTIVKYFEDWAGVEVVAKDKGRGTA